jgi:transcriptional regulator with XRE-family HTH domain
MTPEKFPERLLARRTELGLSVWGLAEVCNISGDIRNYEAGLTSPRVDRVAAMAEALGVHPVWLAFGLGGMDAIQERNLTAEAFGERLSQARSASKLRQQDLAEATGLTQVSIGEMEAGERLPRLDVAMALAKKLGVHPAWLVFGLFDAAYKSQGCLQF